MIKTSICLLLIIASLQVVRAQSSDVSPFDTTMYGRNVMAGHYIKLRGFNMYYETYGKGEPLLIIHGNGGSINNFVYQIPFFAAHYKVIIADSRSQGKSADDNDSLSYEMMADDLSTLLDALHLDSCYVIGWSDGGINGLLLAIRHPGKVKKLAVTGANLWPDTTAVDPFIYQWALSLNDSLQKAPGSSKLKNEIKLTHLLSNEPHITVQQLSHISCPTLVIGGDHDVILPQHAMLISQSIPRSYLWILPGSGHATPVVYKDKFNEGVLEFFSTPYKSIEGLNRLR